MTGETCDTPVPAAAEVDSGDKSECRSADNDSADEHSGETAREKEIGGRDGPDPTRYGDWEKNGRCIDF